jgi:hypothetical protein
LGVLGAGAAGAQAPGERVIVGRVVDSLSGRAIAGAEVYQERGATMFPTAGDGTFRVRGGGPLDTLLIVRRIGYVPRRLAVPLSVSTEIDLGTVLLKAVATQLDRITVEAEEMAFYPHLADFYRRRNLGLAGFFLTREQIERANARKTSNLVERSVKVKTDCNDTGNSRWQKGAPFDCTARNSRPQGSSLGGGQVGVENCEMTVWLDGARTDLRIDEIPVRTIAALEVYSGPATTPAAFGSGHCGVVAIWTRGTR